MAPSMASMARTGVERPRSGAEGEVEPARPRPALHSTVSRRAFFLSERACRFRAGAVLRHSVRDTSFYPASRRAREFGVSADKSRSWMNEVRARAIGALGEALVRLRGRPVHLAGTLSVNRYGGRERAQLRVVDIAEAVS